MIHNVQNVTSWRFVNVDCLLSHTCTILLTYIDTLRQFLDLFTNTEFPKLLILNFGNKLEFSAIQLSAVLTLANHAHAQIAGHNVYWLNTQARTQFTKVQFLGEVSYDVPLAS